MKSAHNTSCSEVGFYNETTDARSPAARRIRRALDGYATTIIRIIAESYGKESLQHAWREFAIGAAAPFLGDDPNAELFFSWLFHRWSPGRGESLEINDESCYSLPPTRAYLSRQGPGLDPLRRRYLEACLAARLSFYEILDCRPYIGFKARDVLAGNEFDVSESLASTTLHNGDIVFAHIVSLDDVALMEAISPFSFPSTLKRQLTGLRLRHRWIGGADLPLRRLYFSLLESHRGSPLPEARTSPYETGSSVTQH